MAQVSFDVAKELESSRPQGEGGSFEFFTLKNDGDQAIVRFLYDDTSTFEIFTVHNVTVGGKYRKVSCIRDPQDVTTACPLCASNNSVSNRFFIRMLEYRVNAQNQVEVHPVVWERSLAYATKLKAMMDEYGPLSDCLFKIKRNGAAGSMDTSYDIFYCSPKVYPEEMYPKIPDAFKDTKLLGTLILDKNYEELEQFIATGSFPSAPQQVAPTTAQVAPPQYVPKSEVPPTYVPTAAPTVASAPQAPVSSPYVAPASPAPVAPVAPAQPVYAAPTQMPPVGAQPTAPQRPTRYY